MMIYRSSKSLALVVFRFSPLPIVKMPTNYDHGHGHGLASLLDVC